MAPLVTATTGLGLVAWTTDWVLAPTTGAPMTAIASAVITAPARMAPLSPRIGVSLVISPPPFIWIPLGPWARLMVALARRRRTREMTGHYTCRSPTGDGRRRFEGQRRTRANPSRV